MNGVGRESGDRHRPVNNCEQLALIGRLLRPPPALSPQIPGWGHGGGEGRSHFCIHQSQRRGSVSPGGTWGCTHIILCQSVRKPDLSQTEPSSRPYVSSFACLLSPPQPHRADIIAVPSTDEVMVLATQRVGGRTALEPRSGSPGTLEPSHLTFQGATCQEGGATGCCEPSKVESQLWASIPGSAKSLAAPHPLTCSLGNSPAMLTCGMLNPSKFPASFPSIIKHTVGAR